MQGYAPVFLQPIAATAISAAVIWSSLIRLIAPAIIMMSAPKKCIHQSHCVPSCSAGLCMPLMYVLGAQKAGSTSVFDLIAEDGSACGCTRPGKTVAWQSKESHKLGHPLSRANYMKIYVERTCASNCFVEGTPSNIREPEAPGRLHSIMTAGERMRARFVVVVREPIARDVSYFNHFVLGKRRASQNESLSLAAATGLYQSWTRGHVDGWTRCAGNATPTTEKGAVALYRRCRSHARLTSASMNPLSIGLYWAQLAMWKSAGWRKESILVVSFDQIMTTPTAVTRRIYGHLGLRSCSNMTSTIPHSNAASAHTGTAVRIIDCGTKRLLKTLYDPWNAMLFKAYGSQLGSRPWTISTVSGADGRAQGDHVPCNTASSVMANSSSAQAATTDEEYGTETAGPKPTTPALLSVSPVQ